MHVLFVDCEQINADIFVIYNFTIYDLQFIYDLVYLQLIRCRF